MTSAKSILPETVSFAANLLHHEEIAKTYQDNLPNFKKPLVSNIEEVNDTFTFKESTIQPDRLDFVEAIIKEIDSHEEEKHYTLVWRRDLCF